MTRQVIWNFWASVSYSARESEGNEHEWLPRHVPLRSTYPRVHLFQCLSPLLFLPTSPRKPPTSFTTIRLPFCHLGKLPTNVLQASKFTIQFHSHENHFLHSPSLNREFLALLYHPLLRCGVRCLQRILSIHRFNLMSHISFPFYSQTQNTLHSVMQIWGLWHKPWSSLLWCQIRHQRSITLFVSQLIPDKAPKPLSQLHHLSVKAAIWDEIYLLSIGSLKSNQDSKFMY